MDDTIYDMSKLPDRINIVRGTARLYSNLTQLIKLAPPLLDRFDFSYKENRGFEDLTEISFGRLGKQIVFRKVIADADRFFDHYYTSAENVQASHTCRVTIVSTHALSEGRPVLNAQFLTIF